MPEQQKSRVRLGFQTGREGSGKPKPQTASSSHLPVRPTPYTTLTLHRYILNIGVLGPSWMDLRPIDSYHSHHFRSIDPRHPPSFQVSTVAAQLHQSSNVHYQAWAYIRGLNRGIKKTNRALACASDRLSQSSEATAGNYVFMLQHRVSCLRL
ncbi:hypothetical protein BDV10DRAFT_152103 [Aspergillus recurvatus]